MANNLPLKRQTNDSSNLHLEESIPLLSPSKKASLGSADNLTNDREEHTKEVKTFKVYTENSPPMKTLILPNQATRNKWMKKMAELKEDEDGDTIHSQQLAEKEFLEEVPALPPSEANSYIHGEIFKHIPKYKEDDADAEMVGLNSPTNGRSCTIHSYCGSSVCEGDILCLHRTTVNCLGVEEDAIKLVMVNDGVKTCTVGFFLPVVQRNIQKFCVVKEIYSESTSKYKRKKAAKMYGVASVIMFDDIPIAE